MRIISSQDLFESYMSKLDEATAMRKRLGAKREAEIRQDLTGRSNAPGSGSRNIDRTIAAAENAAKKYVHKDRNETEEDYYSRAQNRKSTYNDLASNRRRSVRDTPRSGLRYSSTYGKNIRLSPEQQHLSNVRGAHMMSGTFTPRERQNLDPNTKKRYQIKDEFELWVNSLVAEGYDLSDFTWSDMRELYEDYDLYIQLQEYLVSEGYTDTLEGADLIISSMSDEWLSNILDE